MPPYGEFFICFFMLCNCCCGILPPLKGLGSFAAVAVSFADSSLPEGAKGSDCCALKNHRR